MSGPDSCDTFVSVGENCVLFGKNSDRPNDEVQNVAHFPRARHAKDAVLQCTYISIPQVEETFEVLLSKPFWMWGAEMGANEYGVVIGNEAVWTKEPDGPTSLLGMDLLRLGLERGRTATDALHVITGLLEAHNQGGGCAMNDPNWTYHNSFLIADPTSAWVLETAGQWWVAEKVKNVRHLSNSISIGAEFDLCRPGIQEHAREQCFWDGSGRFDFTKAFLRPRTDAGGLVAAQRQARGAALLRQTATADTVTLAEMKAVLRDHEGNLCMHGGKETMGAQISLLSPTACTHFFTGVRHSCTAVFKPVTLPLRAALPKECDASNEPSETLWWLHERAVEGGLAPNLKAALNDLEEQLHQEFEHDREGVNFSDAVAREISLLKSHAN